MLKAVDHYRKNGVEYIELTSAIILMALSIAVPLFVWPGLSSFDLAKITILRLGTLLLLFLWLLKSTIKNEYKLFATPLDLPILSFLVISILATIFSVHPYMSWLGSYKRYDGLTSTINYLFLYYLTVHLITQAWMIKWLSICLTIAGSLSALCGLLQFFCKIDLTGWGGGGMVSTFGNPNFLGGYLAMSFFMSFSLFFSKGEQAKKKKRVKKDSPALLIITGLGFIIIFINLIMTRHRGGILGFLGGGILFLVLLFRQLDSKRLIFSIAALLIASLCLCLNPDTSPLGKFAGTIEVTRQEGQKTAFRFTSTAETRVYIWQTALKIIKDHPWLGVGPDSLRLVSTQYENLDFIRTEGGRNTLIDKAHNEILDTAISRGILGLLSYFWVILWLYRFGWQLFKRVTGFHKIIVVGVLSATSSYLIQNQVGFGVVATSSLFWLLLGMLFPLWRLSKGKAKWVNFSLPFSLRWLICLIVLAGCVFLSYLSIRPYLADIYYKNGLASAHFNQLDNAIASYEKGLAIYKEEFYYGDLLSVYNLKAKQEPDLWQERLIVKAEEAVRVNPLHPYYYNILSSAYGERYVRGDKSAANKAIEACQQALRLKPLFADPHNNLAAIYVQQGKYKQAIKEMEQAHTLFPDDPNYLRILGELNQAIGDLPKAVDYFKETISAAPDSSEAYTKLGRLYFEQSKFVQAKEEFKKALSLNPQDIVALNNLGTIYLKSGQIKEAAAQFKTVLSIDPNNGYAKQMLAAAGKRV